MVSGENEILINGGLHLNRAFDGDVVAVERISEAEAGVDVSAKRRKVQAADSGEEDAAPLIGSHLGLCMLAISLHRTFMSLMSLGK